jgi:hypothetical protein
MARTVWGAHNRYMDTYLNVYKGYYVSPIFPLLILGFSVLMIGSSPVTELDVITKATTGSEAVLTMLSTSVDTACPPPRSKPP